jgi:hypothetical protein
VFTDLSSQLDRQLSAMRGALLVVLPAINGQLKAAGLPPIVPSTEEIPPPPTSAPAASAFVDEEDGN